MTEQNWQVMVSKGIAGDGTVTCFVAALDCLLQSADIPYRIYDEYRDAYLHQKEHGVDNRHTRQTIRKVLQKSLGSTSLKNLRTKRVSTPGELLHTISNANQGGKKIIIWTEPTHVVGIKILSEGLCRMVGNSLPCEDELTLDDLFEFLYLPPRSDKDQSNVYLIN